MRFEELSRSEQWYEIDLGENKFSVSGIGVDLILSTNQVLIMLPDGEVINRNFIRSIKKDIEQTKTNVKKNLPSGS